MLWVVKEYDGLKKPGMTEREGGREGGREGLAT